MSYLRNLWYVQAAIAPHGDSWASALRGDAGSVDYRRVLHEMTRRSSERRSLCSRYSSRSTFPS